MANSFLYSFEPYIFLLLLIHIVISFILSVVLSEYTQKRFVLNTKEVEKKDAHRLEEIEDKSWFYKLLFKVSLHKNNRKMTIIFIFLFNISIPLVGYFFSLWIAWYLKNVSYEKKVSNTNILNLDEFGFSFLKVERIFGESSMTDLMKSEHAPRPKKLKALSALANNPSPANLKIIRQTLSSTDDEIRMFGYAIINKAEKAINVKINHYLEIIHSEDEQYSAEAKAFATNELAFLYWEMIYTELSHESLKENFLQDVIKYVNLAKSFYIPEISNVRRKIEEYETDIKKAAASAKTSKEIPYEQAEEYLKENLKIENERLEKYNEICTKLYIIMGRVYMNKKEYEKAKSEFTLAQQLHKEQLSFIVPYLAEIHFLTGNYRVVHSILNETKNLELNATLYPIIRQWKVS
ncbi:MAG: hypothetical protein OEL19_00080 [Sulfurimonas sp.]|nr:hypothetical protein [Sulfurimonas sp.]